MTDIIRTAANVLKRTIDSDDFHNCGIIACKEADADYAIDHNMAIEDLRKALRAIRTILE